MRIELTYKGFADLSLTTWVPRRLRSPIQQAFRWNGGPPGCPQLSHFAGRFPDIKVAFRAKIVYWPQALQHARNSSTDWGPAAGIDNS